MGESPAESSDRLQARLVELETLCTHLERSLGELDQVVRAQQKQIDALERELAASAAQLAASSGLGAELRPPQDERPPHY